MQQLGLLAFSQTVLTDYGPVTVTATPSIYPVTIIWQPGTPVGCVNGQWTRLPSGEIEATYNDPPELYHCLQFAAWTRGQDLDQIIAKYRGKND